MNGKSLWKWTLCCVFLVAVGLLTACGEKDLSHYHAWYKYSETQVTCEADGLKIFACSCGETKEFVTKAVGHRIETIEEKAATCEEIGWEAHEACVVCGKGERTEYPALGHDLIWHEGREVTCTQNGWNAYEACQRCDYSTCEEKAALGHDYQLKETLRTATCTQTGIAVYGCSICGEDYSDFIDKEEHSLITVDAKMPTCETAGWEEYEACEKCSYRTKAEIPALGHDWDGGEPSEQGLCFTCAICGAIEIEGHTHVWIEEEILENATCLTEGEKRCVCGCGYETLQRIETLPHTYEITYGKAATCNRVGLSDGAICSVCGTVLEEQEVLPKLDHVERIVQGTAATCTASGKTDGVQCENCGVFLVEQTILVAFGHDWSNGIPTTGGVLYACQNCGETRMEEAHEHVYENEVVVIEATCETAGEKSISCSCGAVKKEIISRLGHNYENGTCIRCNATDPNKDEQLLNGGNGDENTNNNTSNETNNSTNSSGNENGGVDSDETASDEIDSSENSGEDTETEDEMMEAARAEELLYQLDADNNAYICIGAKDKNAWDVYIPNRYKGLPVTAIGANAFKSQNRLLRVTIGENVEKIGTGAFFNCPNIVEVYDRSGVAVSSVFYSDVVTIYTKAYDSKLLQDDLGFVTYSMNGENYLFGFAGTMGVLTIPEGVTAIRSNIFIGCAFSKITIAASVEKIDARAFMGVPSTTEIYFAEESVWWVKDVEIPVTPTKNVTAYFTDAFLEIEWRRL